MPSRIVEEIKRVAAEKGMRQREIAAGAGIAESAVCRVLLGHRRPQITTLERLAKAVGREVGLVKRKRGTKKA